MKEVIEAVVKDIDLNGALKDLKEFAVGFCKDLDPGEKIDMIAIAGIVAVAVVDALRKA